MVDYAQATKNFESAIKAIKDSLRVLGLHVDPTIVYLIGHLENNKDWHVDNLINE